MKRTLAYLTVFAVLLPVVLQAESETGSNPTQPDQLKFLENRALVVNIVAQVISDGPDPIWKMETTTFTISGRAVKVKLEGGNVFGFAYFTPYLQEDESILLLAQGEVWVSSMETDEIKYYPTMKSLRIDPGEKILFFPLGLSENPIKQNYRIELEIQVTRLKDTDAPE